LFSRLNYGSLALRAVALLALLVGADRIFVQPTRTFTSGLPTVWSPAPSPDITTVPTGQFALAGLSPAGTSTSLTALSGPICARASNQRVSDNLHMSGHHDWPDKATIRQSGLFPDGRTDGRQRHLRFQGNSARAISAPRAFARGAFYRKRADRRDGPPSFCASLRIRAHTAQSAYLRRPGELIITWVHASRE
jgi:hypothetical protein